MFGLHRELQTAYTSIARIQQLHEELEKFCYNTETRAQKIREYNNELYELLQNKLKVCIN